MTSGALGPTLRRPPHASGGRAGGDVATVHSPTPRQLSRVSVRRDDACDNISIASSDPLTHRDQRQVLRERALEDARTTIEHQREARHQSDRWAGPTMDHPAPGGYDCLPYEVGCPAFTRELRQVRWLSVRTFKPEIPEKYDGRLNPVEFLSICTIAIQATGEEMRRCSPTTSLWPSSPM